MYFLVCPHDGQFSQYRRDRFDLNHTVGKPTKPIRSKTVLIGIPVVTDAGSPSTLSTNQYRSSQTAAYANPHSTRSPKGIGTPVYVPLSVDVVGGASSGSGGCTGFVGGAPLVGPADTTNARPHLHFAFLPACLSASENSLPHSHRTGIMLPALPAALSSNGCNTIPRRVVSRHAKCSVKGRCSLSGPVRIAYRAGVQWFEERSELLLGVQSSRAGASLRDPPRRGWPKTDSIPPAAREAQLYRYSRRRAS